MSEHRSITFPSPEELDRAMRRARRLRSAAFAATFAGLYRRLQAAARWLGRAVSLPAPKRGELRSGPPAAWPPGWRTK